MNAKTRNNFLLLTIVLPLVMLPMLVTSYTVIESFICNDYKQLESIDYCDYPERFEMYGGLPTNFYRYVGSYFGREEGTSPSLRSNLQGNVSMQYPYIDEIGRSVSRKYLKTLDAFAIIASILFMLSVALSLSRLAITLKRKIHVKRIKKV